MLSVTELRVKAQKMRECGDRQTDAGAAHAYRAMADVYDLMADHRETGTGPWQPTSADTGVG
jgi:hypothetical protein